MRNLLGVFSKAVIFLFCLLSTLAAQIDKSIKQNATGAVPNAALSKFLYVNVGDEQQRPIEGANVIAESQGKKDIVKGVTDEEGMAKLECRQSATYNVKVEHPRFQMQEDKIEINQSDEQNYYFLVYTLKKKDNIDEHELRPLKVTVMDQKTRKVIGGAEVTAGKQTIQTDKTGVAFFEHATELGEKGLVHVAAQGYKSQEQSFIAGGEQYRYAHPSQDELVVYLEGGRPDRLTLLVEVFDYASQRPVRNASVTLTDNRGWYLYIAEITDSKGQARVSGKGEALDYAPWRVKVIAKGYQQSWSDVSADLLNSGNDPVVFAVYLKKQKGKEVAAEKKFGPFLVPSSRWVSTGVSFKKGDYFRVETSGYFTAKDGQKIGPGGGGYWNWWVLTGQIGPQRVELGKDGGATVSQDGVLELGTPRGLGSKEFVKEDIENLKGTLTVYVFSKAGAADQLKTYNYEEAQADLRMLVKIRDRDQTFFAQRTPDEISGEFRRITAKYEIHDFGADVNGRNVKCSELLLSINQKGTKTACDDCLNQAIEALKIKIDKIKR